MKLNTPTLYLSKKGTSNEGEYNYTLQAITYFNNTDYISAGHDTFQPSLNAMDRHEIVLKVDKSSGIDRESLTPVVHTVDLGINPFTNSNLLEVRVETLEDVEVSLVGKGILHDDDADEDSRPI